MRPPISFFVQGLPIAQPRARSRGFGKGVYCPTTAEPWKSAIRAAWLDLNQPVWEGPTRVDLRFWFLRPASHFRSGKNAHILKENAPGEWYESKPDRDNLDKAILDALTITNNHSGAWADDARVCCGWIAKRWSQQIEGVSITIMEACDIDSQNNFGTETT